MEQMKSLKDIRKILAERCDILFGLAENTQGYGNENKKIHKVLQKIGIIIN